MKMGKEYYVQPECEVLEMRTERHFCQSQGSVKASKNNANEGVNWGDSSYGE